MPKNKVSVSIVSTGEKHKSKPNKIEIVPFTIKKTLLTEENDLIIANIPATIINTPQILIKFAKVLKGFKKNKIPIIPNKIPSTMKRYSKNFFIIITT
ncbi:hypothetical protein HMPREF0216_03003 [Clostridium celatum DSM 1785]|uniref:Uncharacterized protein n=1 Tax=Clostridium celatum DSM 1785 TaxID=545697 RepID=L1Q5G5_9CLOT|nr:hypothetical protein HMPREF0216_03003 [Clostridium celatum DSM 1785]